MAERIKDIPHSQRISMVAAIQETIPRDRITIQETGSGLQEMWGFVWLKCLPFCFRAWPKTKKLEFLENGLTAYTTWGFVHKPYEPLNLVVPTGGITEEDMLYIIKGLKVKDEEIKTAADNRSLPQLFRTILTAKQGAYQDFDHLYSEDFFLRKAYASAVSLVCDEKEAERVLAQKVGLV